MQRTGLVSAREEVSGRLDDPSRDEHAAVGRLETVGVETVDIVRNYLVSVDALNPLENRPQEEMAHTSRIRASLFRFLHIYCTYRSFKQERDSYAFGSQEWKTSGNKSAVPIKLQVPFQTPCLAIHVTMIAGSLFRRTRVLRLIMPMLS